MKHYDVFLSHATADKIDYVDELKRSFEQLGINVFYDSDSIEWGDNWKDKIMRGLANSRFGVIVISENYFGREWTDIELKSLLSRQKASGQKVVLPILYNTSIEKINRMYKNLSDIQFMDASIFNIQDITIQLARILLSEQKTECEIEYNAIFEKLFKDMRSLDFYKWIESLINNGNQFTEDYCPWFNGWHLIDTGNNPPIFQTKENCAGETLLRVNPVYFEALKVYFERKIKPQI